MTEPAASLVTAGVVATTVSAAAWWTGLDPEAVFGAFCGATTFALTSRDTTWLPRIVYAAISLAIGYSAVPDVAAAQDMLKNPFVISFAVSAIAMHVTVVAIEKIRNLDVRQVWDAVVSVWPWRR